MVQGSLEVITIDSIRGYACVFNRWSAPVNDDGFFFTELIKPNAFNLLCSGTIYCDFSHCSRTRFAGTGDGSLRAWTDSYGLAFEADIPATTLGAGIRNMLCSGTMQASFGITSAAATWDYSGERPRRIVSQLTIDHIAVAVDGAYPTNTWLASMPEHFMSDEVAELAHRWQVSDDVFQALSARRRDRMASGVSTIRPQGTAARTPAVAQPARGAADRHVWSAAAPRKHRDGDDIRDALLARARAHGSLSAADIASVVLGGGHAA